MGVKVAPPEAHVIVAGNKCDLADQVDTKALESQIQEAATGEGTGHRTGKVTHFGPCSAKTGKGVKELFETAVKLTYCSATSSTMTADDIAISRVTNSFVETARN